MSFLIPCTPTVERLEMDRTYRALAPRKPNGPPRDKIVKLHYHHSKEQLLAAARGKDPLNFQDHTYQLFADLSPLTIAKRRALKPQLLILQRNQIAYNWGFPFSLRFIHLETKYTCQTPAELQLALIEMGFVDQVSPSDHTRRRSASHSPSQQKMTDSGSSIST